MTLRMKAAMLGIAGVVSIVYVFSLAPYMLGAKDPSSLPLLQIIMPAMAFPLLALIIFAVPRRAVGLTPDSVAHDKAELRFKERSLVSGAAAGLIAASILVGMILAGDSVLGLPFGTFYSIIGVSMAGLEVPAAVYYGIALHLLTGTLVGATFGYVTAVTGPFNITGVAKGAGAGVLAGFVTFSLLFIPLTRFEIEPSLLGILASIYPPETSAATLQNKTLDIMSAVLAGSILMHMVFGAVMGSITAVFLSKRKVERAADSTTVVR